MVRLLVIALATALFASCGVEDDPKPVNVPKVDPMGSCTHIHILGTRQTGTEFGHSCMSGVIDGLKITQSYCERIGNVYDKKGEFYAFVPDETCSRTDMAAICVDPETSGQKSFIGLLDTELYDIPKATRALKNLCQSYGLSFSEL